MNNQRRGFDRCNKRLATGDPWEIKLSRATISNTKAIKFNITNSKHID